MLKTTSRGFTGWHAAAMLVAFFGVVIAVNVYMARLASTTFGGIVVDNSYVASQHFNRWLDEAKIEQALGWKAKATLAKDGHIHLTLAGAPAEVKVTAIARHPLGHLGDRDLAFRRTAQGEYISIEALPATRWRLRIEAQGGSTIWRGEDDVQ